MCKMTRLKFLTVNRKSKVRTIYYPYQVVLSSYQNLVEPKFQKSMEGILFAHIVYVYPKFCFIRERVQALFCRIKGKISEGCTAER